MPNQYSIVGMNFAKSEAIVQAMQNGDAVLLVREPMNKYDSNAVAVWFNGKRIGYVPKKQNHVLAPFIDQAGTDLTYDNLPTVAMDAALAPENAGASPPKFVPAKYQRSPNSGYPLVIVDGA